ncbi:MAG: GtrA family protein [Oscillospiraceae bacterium]|nr:GtrA family protein [Oscillospiraceae bacterium]
MSTQLEQNPNTVEAPKDVKTMDAQDRFLAKHPKLKAFTDKHPELYKIMKFFAAGAIANGPELLTQLLFLNVVFASLRTTMPPSNALFDFASNFIDFQDGIGGMYAYMVSTAVGYTIAYILNRKISFQANNNVALSTFLYAIMVVFTIVANGFIGPFIEQYVARLGTPELLTQTVAKLLCMAVPGLWTYPCNRFIIHRQVK